MERLGHPQDRVPAVHIVGTAGKGTVAGLISESLRSAGQTVGLHRSPHVDDVRERFTVASSLPDWDQVGGAINEVAPAVDELVDAGRPATYFAVTMALSVVLARQAETEWLVVEAGIGGRNDATNVFHRDDVLTVITAVGVDHQEVLGADPVGIAGEKSAVMAGRRRCVLGPQPVAACRDAIRGWADVFGNELVEVHADGPWTMQAEAIAAAALTAVGSSAVPARFSGGLGRFELHQWAAGTLIFDGAHNPLKLQGLAELLADHPRPRLAVVALGEGKDVLGCAQALAGVVDDVVVTEFGPQVDRIGPRSWPAATVAEVFASEGFRTVTQAPTSEHAAQAAIGRAAPTTVVTGSFLHLAEMRARLLPGGSG